MSETGAAHVFLGVSLSNRIFNRAFVKRFSDWLINNHVQDTLIIIFDKCEVVNMKVFGGLTALEAQVRLADRTEEMKKMFQRFLSLDRVTIGTQTEREKHMPALIDLEKKLRHGYLKKQTFYNDVRHQININLHVKEKKVGRDIIENNLDELSEYIILELAWFYAFFDANQKATVEVYPGPELSTKRKLIQGKYETETGIPSIKRQPQFINILSTLGVEVAHA